MLVVLAKVGPPEMVGQFALALAVTTPIIMLSMLQLRAVQATDARSEYEFGHYLALRLITSFAALLVVAVVAFLSGYRAEVALLILAVGSFKAVESVTDAYHGLMQKHERMERIALAQMIKGPLFLAALATVVLLSGSMLLGVAAMTAGSLAMLVGYERGNALRLLGAGHCHAVHPRWEWARLSQLAQLAFPLGLVMMLASLNANIPRYFIERALGERELGYFAALAYLQVAGVLVIGAFGQSASPRLAHHYAAGRYREYARLLRRMIAVAVLLGVGCVTAAQLFGRELLTLLYRADYAQHASLLVWLMIAAGLSFVASVLGYGMTAARLFRAQVPLYAASAVFLAAVSSIAVPAFGMMGAAQVLAAVAAVQIAGSATMIWWVTRRLPSQEWRMP